MKDIAALLSRFSNAHGLSGYEDEVAALLRAEMEPLVDEVTIDKMGNVIGVRAGEGPTVMVAAHMDEIGGHGLPYRRRRLSQDGPCGRLVRPDHPRATRHDPHARRQAHPRSGRLTSAAPHGRRRAQEG